MLTPCLYRENILIFFVVAQDNVFFTVNHYLLSLKSHGFDFSIMKSCSFDLLHTTSEKVSRIKSHDLNRHPRSIVWAKIFDYVSLLGRRFSDLDIVI